MASISLINAVTGVGANRPQLTARTGSASGSRQADNVSFSQSSPQISLPVSQAISSVRNDPVQMERIAEAKQSLADGVHRIQEVVLQVAERLENTLR